MRLALDLQHQSDPRKPADRGAAYQGLVEADVTWRLALHLDRALRERNTVYRISDGAYRDRHARVNALGCDLYLALHCNAGLAGRTGDRTELYHWPGSEGGIAHAEAIATALHDVVPWPVKILPASTGDQRATVAGTRCPALLVETGFVDGALGRAWLAAEDNLVTFAAAIARGLS